MTGMDASDSGKIDVSFQHRSDGARVAFVTVSRPNKRNALGTFLIRQLTTVFRALATDAHLTTVVLTGAGEQAFIAGADLNELGAFCQDSARGFISHLHQACAAIRACPVPVIARINGICLGAGLELAASCDMRVAVTTATLGMPEVRMGIPSVIEAALLPGLIGWGRTRMLLLTGENIAASEALAMGLVEKVAARADLDVAVDKWIDGIAASGPKAVRAQKALITRWERTSVEEGILAGIDALADAYLTPEPRERIGAHLTARASQKELAKQDAGRLAERSLQRDKT